MNVPARVTITGSGVNPLTLETATALVVGRAATRAGGYVCFADLNSLMTAERDPEHRRRLERAWLVTPDGMPVVWLCRRRTRDPVTRVYGPDVVEAVCRATAGTPATHYFYGAAPGTAEALAQRLQERFPGLKVAGWESPPFRPLTAPEEADLAARLAKVRPDFLWVGLSTPKQEAFMAALEGRLDVGVTLGVGAAFDFLSGRVRQAPRWIQRSGLEWLFRVCTEPRRLTKRYLRNGWSFLRALQKS
ncbi:WecB/TagA/CpsF family glycosyltransferase [Nibricoccus sp. IMCC34717]|uniref:WecB/TagA/CpsF family glycosyltransferase n=1 Tax=Nibricoccus sp. IMCC34717 TaxID=3034021 RepID=UPI00384CA586